MAVIAILLSAVLSANAQTFFVSTTSPSGYKLYKVTKADTGFVSQQMSLCGQARRIVSIAMNRSDFFWSDDAGNLYRGKVAGNALVECESVKAIPLSVSLTMGPDSNLYSASTSLYRTDPVLKSTTALGDLNYASFGDMTFYAGELYTNSSDGIVKINISNPGNSSIHIPFPESGSFYGLINVEESPGIFKVYAFFAGNNDTTTIFEVDIEGQRLAGEIGTLPFKVFDAASPAENGINADIILNSIALSSTCDQPGETQVNISASASSGDLRFKLNNQDENTTGIFNQLTPGNYAVNIISPADTLDTAFVVPPSGVVKPIFSYKYENPECGLPGEIKFSSPETGDEFQLEYDNKLHVLNQEFLNLPGGVYRFNVLNKAGCRIDSVEIILVDQECMKVTFPSVFTPNGDGLNDVFRPNRESEALVFRLKIYNRWGKLVYEGRDLLEGWNGQDNGKPAVVAVYYWIADYTTNRNKRNVQKGTVLLLK